MIDVILQPCKAGEDLVVIAGSKYLAHVAELVDAADSKSAIRKGVKVRFLSWAHNQLFSWFFNARKRSIYNAFSSSPFFLCPFI